MNLIAVKNNEEIKVGSIKKVAAFIGVHPNTVSRWVNSGDRKVLKNGFEIFLNVEKL